MCAPRVVRVNLVGWFSLRDRGRGPSIRSPSRRWPRRHILLPRRHRLLTVSRDLTAVLWDLSSPSSSDLAGMDSFPGVLSFHPAWGVEGAASAASARSSGWSRAQGKGTAAPAPSSHAFYGEMAPGRVSTTVGLPDNFPGMCPASVDVVPLGATRAGSPSLFGGDSTDGRWGRWGRGGSERISQGGERDRGKLKVLFAAAGDGMVASVVREEEGARDSVYPSSFVGPSGRRVYSSSSRRSSAGGLIVRSAAVLPLRRLLLLGCADGRVRVGT